MISRWQMKRVAHLLILFLVPAIALGVATHLALAHADYERSEPAAGAVIAEPPAEVRVWFTQELFRREGENTLEVTGPDGSRVDQGDARIDDDDRTLMIVSLSEELPDGDYTVHWVTLSVEDGHGGEGEFAFTVDPSSAGQVPEPEAEESSATGEGVPDTASPPPAEEDAATPAPAPEAERASSTTGVGCPGGLLLPLPALLVGWLHRERRFSRRAA